MKGTIDITVACTLNTTFINAMNDVAEQADYTVEHPLISGTEVVDVAQGSSHLIIRLFFECDLDESQIQDVISECDYNVHHEYVTGTEIIHHE
jgi:hypothetical protein